MLASHGSFRPNPGLLLLRAHDRFHCCNRPPRLLKGENTPLAHIKPRCCTATCVYACLASRGERGIRSLERVVRDRMRIILATPILHPRAGGPAYSVTSIGRTLESRGLAPLYVTGWGSQGYRPSAPSLSSLVRANVVHNFGLWGPFNHGVSWLSRMSKRPLVICPMGTLEPWCLAHKPLRKRVALRFYQRNDLDAADVLHATAQSEAASFRALGLRAPIAVIPHGIDIPEAVSSSTECEGRAVRTALFMSRIHPKKGLLNLVEAWAHLRPAGWQMVIAGPDENGHRATVEAAVAKHGLETRFEFLGRVQGEQKSRLFRDADLFVLPTYSENFGNVIPEALAHGIPVITTTGAPWNELVETRSGWWIEPGVEPLSVALAAAFSLPPQELRAMGQRGSEMVRARYAWSSLIAKHIALYHWLLSEGPRPEFVTG